jgi:nucleoside-diphosphate-sugar epimerase
MESIFVTGGTGFIGPELLKLIVAAGYRARVLVRSEAGAQKVRALGCDAILGDILWAGPWQQEALNADYIMHLAQPLTFGGRITQARARKYQTDRIKMDRLLLSILTPQKTKRILYVAGTSYYGNMGKTLANEDFAPNPRGWGRSLAPAVDALQQDIARGLPIVKAFPGYIYGNGSWFIEFVVKSLVKNRAFILLKEQRRLATMMHVRDCARALLHLLLKGEIGKNYFVVDNEPCQSDSSYLIAARHWGVTPRIREVPPLLCRLLMGDLLTEMMQSDASLSNQKLRDTGFTLEFPTPEEGIAEVVKEIKNSGKWIVK